MIHEISTNIWKLETTPLNNPWVKEEITIRKKIECKICGILLNV